MSALYTFAGFSPNDGLGEGRWVRKPGRHHLVWEGELERPATKPGPKPGPRTAECVDCKTEVDRRALRCRSCASVEAKRVKRDWARKVRSEAVA